MDLVIHSRFGGGDGFVVIEVGNDEFGTVVGDMEFDGGATEGVVEVVSSFL